MPLFALAKEAADEVWVGFDAGGAGRDEDTMLGPKEAVAGLAAAKADRTGGPALAAWRDLNYLHSDASRCFSRHTAQRFRELAR